MTWVLLRGLIREQRHWGDFPAQLQRAFPAERIVTLDFPGNGSRHRENSASSIAAMVEFVHAELARLQVTGPVQVLAISLGAMVAIGWAQRYPQQVQRLVLINTSVAPHNRFYQRLRPQNYLALLASSLRSAHQQREQVIFDLTSNSPRRRSELVARWRSYAEEFPVSRRNSCRQLLAALRYRAPLQAPAVPLLLLAGAGDRLVNPCCSSRLAALWHAPLRLHATAGHDLPLDDANWIIQQLQH